MITALWILGVIMLIADVLTTILAMANGAGILVSLVSGVLGLAGGLSLIALAGMKEQMNVLEEKLDEMAFRAAKAPVEQQTCTRCGKSYDADYTSCPYCGQKA